VFSKNKGVQTNSRPVAINALSVWVAISVSLATISHGQPETGPAASCTKRFPYGAERFLEKLIVVADEVNPDSVVNTFQHVFDVSLRVVEKIDYQLRIYNAAGCEWYAHVVIGTGLDQKVSGGERVVLILGDFPSPLLFGSHGDECLSSKLADKLLTASSWKERLLSGELVYRKGSTKFEYFASGKMRADDDSCISSITIRFR
jgi:hypothetical protein